MSNERNIPGREDNPTVNRLENQSSVPNDLPDSPQDSERLQGEEIRIDLPDVKDIPGQEFVHVPSLGEMADTTLASADEEGANIIGLNDDDGEAVGDTSRSDFDVSRDEREALRDTTYMPTRDENNLRQARMDNVDFDGDELNEASFGQGQSLSGSDLDTGDMADETKTDAMGQGDEENKHYSLDDTDRNQPAENRTGA
jgi:hypothetical protein